MNDTPLGAYRAPTLEEERERFVPRIKQFRKDVDELIQRVSRIPAAYSERCPRGTPENRPTGDVSKPANEKGRTAVVITHRLVCRQEFSFSVPSALPILDSTGRRIRLRRDATGAPTQGRNGAGGASRPTTAILAESVKSREREGRVLAVRKAAFLMVQLSAATLVRQLFGPHFRMWP